MREARSRHSNYFPVSITTEHPSYYRYGLVRISLTLRDSRGSQITPLNTGQSAPAVIVERRGEAVETVGGVKRLSSKYDPATQTYVCDWPVPWNAPPGKYVAGTRYKLQDPDLWPWLTAEEELRRRRTRKDGETPVKATGPAFCVAKSAFEIKARRPTSMPAGMCAATWEQILPTRGTRMRTPSGEMGDWRTVFEWCEFMGADTLWVRGALTRSADPPLTMKAPFVKANLDAIAPMAAEAHRRGLKFGTWATAYATLPHKSNRNKPPYKFAKDISRSTGEIKDTEFVSFFDRRREAQLAQFFKDCRRDPNIDFVGLDYMRTEPGYELTDDFADTMPVSLPSAWDEMSQAARWKYVAKRVEPPGCYENPTFYESWNWYRAHLGAQRVANIVQAAEIKKPLWIFSLSWRHGVQHGQDPLMFTDAGADIIAPMLYEVSGRDQFEFIVKDWKEYLRPGQVTLVCGDQVDNRSHQRMGPEELYRRMIQAHEQFIPGGRTQGAFWHDISRAAMVGNLGPYPPSEWALAGGAAFSKTRETWAAYPLKASLEWPKSASVGAAFELRVKLENISDKAVRRIKIKPMATRHVKFSKPSPRQIVELGPHQSLSVPFHARITQESSQRKNRFMAAMRITWATGRYGESFQNDLPRVIILITDTYIQLR